MTYYCDITQCRGEGEFCKPVTYYCDITQCRGEGEFCKPVTYYCDITLVEKVDAVNNIINLIQLCLVMRMDSLKNNTVKVIPVNGTTSHGMEYCGVAPDCFSNNIWCFILQ